MKEKKKIIVLSSLKYEFLPLLHITARKLREKSFWLLWLCDMRQHFLSDIIGNYLVKKLLDFFFNSCPLPLHTYFMVDKAKSICSFVDHKEISFVCFAELFRLVPNHHFWGITIIWKRRGSRRGCLVDLSVAINFDEVFKYVMQGHSLPSSKYFWAVVPSVLLSVARQKCSVDPSQPIRTLTVFTNFFIPTYLKVIPLNSTPELVHFLWKNENSEFVLNTWMPLFLPKKLNNCGCQSWPWWLSSAR